MNACPTQPALYHKTALALVFISSLLFALAGHAQPTETTSRSVGKANGEASVTYKKQTTKRSGKPDIKPVLEKPRLDTARHLGYNDVWFYSASTDLYYDEDHDGYFSGFSIRFDADTIHLYADVYALLYLSYEGGPWRHYYTTDYFTIWNSSATDDYHIDTDLLTGYGPGHYDVLIELFDADTSYLVADYGPYLSSALSHLPLEDALHDVGYVVCDYDCDGAVSHGGGGSHGLLGGLLLMGLAYRKLKTTRNA